MTVTRKEETVNVKENRKVKENKKVKEDGKIAIAALNKEATATVSTQAGRAPYYLFFEGGTLVEAWKNPFASGGGGAGWSVARVLQEKGVGVVVAGKFGGNMEAALAEAGVKAVTVEGNVAEALSSIEKKGESGKKGS